MKPCEGIDGRPDSCQKQSIRKEALVPQTTHRRLAEAIAQSGLLDEEAEAANDVPQQRVQPTRRSGPARIDIADVDPCALRW